MTNKKGEVNMQNENKNILTNHDINSVSEWINHERTIINECLEEYFSNPEKTTLKSSEGLLYQILYKFAQKYSESNSAWVEKKINEHTKEEYLHLCNPYKMLLERYSNFMLNTAGKESLKELLENLSNAYDDLISSFESAQQTDKQEDKRISFNLINKCMINYYSLIKNSLLFKGNYEL